MRIDTNHDSDGPVSEAIMDRAIHSTYEVLVELKYIPIKCGPPLRANLIGGPHTWLR